MGFFYYATILIRLCERSGFLGHRHIQCISLKFFFFFFFFSFFFYCKDKKTLIRLPMHPHADLDLCRQHASLASLYMPHFFSFAKSLPCPHCFYVYVLQRPRLNRVLIILSYQTFLIPHSIRDNNIIGIKHGFSCLNIRQVPWEVLKTEAEGRVFNISQGTWRMLMH